MARKAKSKLEVAQATRIDALEKEQAWLEEALRGLGKQHHSRGILIDVLIPKIEELQVKATELEDIKRELEMLWSGYAKAKDSTLTSGAIELKNAILVLKKSSELFIDLWPESP